MPPVFKKPLEYDPSQAERTLQHTYSKSEAAQEAKKKSFLAELGLADEEYNVTDEDDDMQDEDEEDNYMGNGNISSHGVENGAVAKYHYKDLFGKEFEKRRRQLIEVKGYDKYFSDLLARSNESLQALRKEIQLQYPGNVEVIPELQHELEALYQEVKAVKENSNISAAHQKQPSVEDQANVREMQQLLHRLRTEVMDRDKKIAQLQEEAKDMERRLMAANTAVAAGSSSAASNEKPSYPNLAPQLEKAQASIIAKDNQIAQLSRQVENLNAEMRGLDASNRSLEIQTDLARSRAAEESLTRRVNELESSIQKLKNENASLSSQLASAASAASAQRSLSTSSTTASTEVGILQERLNTILSEHQMEVVELHKKSDAKLAAQSSDFNGTLAKCKTDYESQLAQLKSRVSELEADLGEKEDVISQIRHTKSDALAQMKEMSAKAKQAKAEAISEVRDKMEAMYGKLDELHALRESVLEELVSFRSDIFNEKTLLQMSRLVRDKEVTTFKKHQLDSKNKVVGMETKVAEIQRELDDRTEHFQQALKIKDVESQGQIAHFRERWRQEFERRKKLHNLVSELKGNIRVICRVRPLLPRELGQTNSGGNGNNAHLPLQCASEEVLRISTDKGEKDFEFDRVFSIQDGQEKVYDEVSGLVVSTLDGYNVSIMAYGQTGSGKTYTMEGPDLLPGVNMRALSDLFKFAEERKDELTYTFSASVLEIYNENIYDLLAGGGAKDGPHVTGFMSSGSGFDRDGHVDRLDVKQGPEGMYVPGLKVEEVADLASVQHLIQLGKSNRSTFATNMNEHSSRSHLVLSVYVRCVNRITNVTLRGKLHLIDLAGSERLSRTGAQGDRLKEAQAINKSLAALGDVISALQQRSPHIPYRNSKLTRLLEDSLGGNSKCVLIVNVSPAPENTGESKCSLEFASRARKVELGRAKQNVVLANGGGGGGASVVTSGDGGSSNLGNGGEVGGGERG
eukprot:CAMPEP_0175077182 /NCGR_PEP_ID=MMETSP0052_2-20121109/23226_1 /TAXON_ID=51329 ORGANISM="Polytomella parva, Strain SAG 63-3" /NCGR_SAMPLE_ID=MMETSP0052_2 /ASSEMBLY_ACC=CAM_ASM_000194 /LENGTH=971 /DNA_ID=CAMNT_0016346575 /DNA_START=77 /DNA_END=2988 /DNA_ORIENTATION=+